MNYLIIGSSYKLIQKEIDKIVNKRNYKTYSLLDISLGEVLTDAGYVSMFDDEKIIVLKNFESVIDNKNNELDMLNEYLNEQSNTTLIIVCSVSIPSKSKTNKEILSKLKVIETKNPTKQYEVASLIRELANNLGFRITDNALNSFCLKCAYNIDIAIMELEKLKLMKKNDNLITDDDVRELVSNYNASDVFELKDAITSRDIKRAKELIDDAETAKLEVIPIIVMLVKEYELLYAILKLSKQRKTNEEIGEILGKMHPYRIKMLRPTANKYTEEELKKIILYLCNVDLKCVSEDNLGFGELKKFLLEL